MISFRINSWTYGVRMGRIQLHAPTRQQAIEEALNLFFIGTHAYGDTVILQR